MNNFSFSDHHEATSNLNTSDLLDELLEDDTLEDSPTTSNFTVVTDSLSISDFSPVTIMSMKSTRDYIQKKDAIQLHAHESKRLQKTKRIKPCNLKYYKQVLTIGKGVKPFKCALCEFTAKRKGGVLQHLRKHTHERPYSCSLCDFKGSQQNHLDEHFRKIHIEKRVLKCNKCDFETTLNVILKKHKQLEHSKLDKHMSADQLGERLLQCEHCTFSTLYRTGLTRHVRSRHKAYATSVQLRKGLLKCEQCDFTTLYKNYLDRHVTKSHKIVAKETFSQAFKCQMCHFRTLHKKALARHITMAHKRYSETSSDVGQPSQHDEIPAEAQGKKLLECKQCSFTTLYAKYLACHITKSHKDVLLRQSPATKGVQSQLISFRVKPKSKTLKCMHCSFRTAWETSLYRHVTNSHKDVLLRQSPATKRVPYQLKSKTHLKCTQCSFRTLWNTSLYRHVTKTHKATAMLFTCKECGVKTSSKAGLVIHFSKFHKTKKNISELMPVQQLIVKPRVLKCKACKFRTLNKRALLCHTTMAHKSCSKPSLKETLSGQLGKKLIKCKECNFNANVFPKRKLQKNTKSEKLKESI